MNSDSENGDPPLPVLIGSTTIEEEENIEIGNEEEDEEEEEYSDYSNTNDNDTPYGERKAGRRNTRNSNALKGKQEKLEKQNITPKRKREAPRTLSPPTKRAQKTATRAMETRSSSKSLENNFYDNLLPITRKRKANSTQGNSTKENEEVNLVPQDIATGGNTPSPKVVKPTAKKSHKLESENYSISHKCVSPEQTGAVLIAYFTGHTKEGNVLYKNHRIISMQKDSSDDFWE